MGASSVNADPLKYFAPSKRQNPGNRMTQSYLSVFFADRGVTEMAASSSFKRSLPQYWWAFLYPECTLFLRVSVDMLTR
jgi:hypothetical protein